MTTVYLDPVGTAVADPADGRVAVAPALPGAVEALTRLCEARYDVIVLSAGPLPAFEELDGQLRYETRPAQPESGSREAAGAGDVDRPWMIASDRGWTDLDRPRGARTIRVGPRRPAGRRTATRFDLEARDLPAAVMEILVRDVMP